MHIDSASLLANAALIAVGILTTGFMVWFLMALTMEKNGMHVRCRMELKLDEVSTAIVNRQSIREVASPRPSLDIAQPVFRSTHMVVTHRALRAVGHTAKSDLADESWQGKQYLIH